MSIYSMTRAQIARDEARAKARAKKLQEYPELADAYDLVAGSRQRKVLRAKFNPLVKSQAQKLQDLITVALMDEDIKTGTALKQSLLSATNSLEIAAVTEYEKERNRERVKAQKTLYKSLKKFLG